MSNETGSPESRGLVDLVNFYGSYGAQIGARADSFLHQLRGIDREHLPLSVHLRETAPPDTLQLYKWYGVIGKERDADEAIRTIERLYADFNWARINTVYASGQGDVAMAFIKDEIGNWNLKSFDNDPTELLQHYTDLTKVVIKGAADVARAALAPGSNVGNALLQQSLEAAGRVTSGRLGSAGAAEVANVKALRDRLLDRLAALGAEAKVTGDALAAERAKAATEEQAAKAAVDTANGEAAAAKTALDGGSTETRATIEANVRASAADVEARVARLIVEVEERAKTDPLLVAVLGDARAARQAKNEAEALLASAPEAGVTAQAGKARLTVAYAGKLIALAEMRRDAANRQRDVANAAAKTAAHGSDVAAKLRRLLDDQAAVLDALHLIVIPPKAEPAQSSGVVSAATAAATGAATVATGSLPGVASLGP